MKSKEKGKAKEVNPMETDKAMAKARQKARQKEREKERPKAREREPEKMQIRETRERMQETKIN